MPYKSTARRHGLAGRFAVLMLQIAVKTKMVQLDRAAGRCDMDHTATALLVAGAKADNLDGVDLLPYLSGQKPGAPHDTLYWRFGQQMAIRAGDFKLVRYDNNADTQTGKRNQGVTAARLYNLADDQGEAHDLAAAQPEKVRQLQTTWDTWDATLPDPLWGDGRADNERPEKGSKKAKRAKD